MPIPITTAFGTQPAIRTQNPQDLSLRGMPIPISCALLNVGAVGSTRTSMTISRHPSLKRTCIPVPPRRQYKTHIRFGGPPRIRTSSPRLRRSLIYPIDLVGLDFWQPGRESNPQPAVLETTALPTELPGHSYTLDMPAGFEPA